MSERPVPHGFWEGAGAGKEFTHRLDPELLTACLPRDARVLDYGCGYGRLTAQLVDLGYQDVRGVDPSRAMIRRGHREHPELDLVHLSVLPLPSVDASYDAALLFVVLNCVPEDAGQRAILREVARLVRPGGVLYVSDVPVQSDARHLQRYEAGAPGHSAYGVFTTDEGGLFRHHHPQHLRTLLHEHGFRIEQERPGTAASLQGHTTGNLQVIARRVQTVPETA
ncbi:class I SAM-dependent methyltransferase [Streptomyces sp. N2-109]|uniref:Class I SAM-dependent methyltransferase n=1 Tax=Streptomyces gossypii TaxID=2883101 RepID=A0ABT2JMH6_9ACTN|nr:class I SAM-dependent methyltransferase [Streptomyces gossypii]MCT2588941.1 class I SAM-dependent methyltransferase [Streptomyces gossypii]